MQEKWWHNAVVYQVYPKSFMDSNGRWNWWFARNYEVRLSEIIRDYSDLAFLFKW